MSFLRVGLHRCFRHHHLIVILHILHPCIFSIDNSVECCSRTDLDGNACTSRDLDFSQSPCQTYEAGSERDEAAQAVVRFADPRSAVDITGPFSNNNQPFFDAFAVAWEKATTNGWTNLSTLSEACVPDASPSQSPSANPTKNPSAKPSFPPTNEPSLGPSSSPTNHSSSPPSAKPVSAPPSTNVSHCCIFPSIRSHDSACRHHNFPTAHWQPN